MKENIKEMEKKFHKGQGNYNPKPPMQLKLINAKTYKLINTLNPNRREAKKVFDRKPFYCK